MALDNHVWSHLTRTRIPQTREAAARASQDLRRALCLAAPSLLWNQAWRGRGWGGADDRVWQRRESVMMRTVHPADG